MQVSWMQQLQARIVEAKTSHDKEILQHQIDAMDRQIDRMVYELYSLTNEEIAIVDRAV